MAKRITYNKALVILGPSTTGKTEVAFDVASRLRGELINGDKFYLFSGFPTSIGLSSFFGTKEVPTHLYQILTPSAERLSLVDYLLKVNKLVPQILKRKHLPIVEGCSYGYTNAIMELDMLLDKSRYGPFIGLRWPQGYDINSKVEKRIEQLFSGGLISEIEKGLQEGYEYSFPMRKGVITVPVVEMLQGKINETQAKDKIIIGMLDAVYSSLRKFLDTPNVYWIEHTSETKENTISQIEKLVMENNR